MSIGIEKQGPFTTPKQILLFPDHYVNTAETITADKLADYAEDGYIKAGTIYPANDATAKGVIFNDYNVEDGFDVTVAIVVHGFIKNAALPEAPTAEAKAALPMIQFV